MNIYEKISELIAANTPCTFCTIVKTKGSTPRKAGSKMIVLEDGKIFGTVGGGAIEMAAIQEAKALIKTGGCLLKEYQLEDDLSMKCGGFAEIYFESILNAPSLYIFGAGHVGRAVGKISSELGFRITFFDERPDIYKEFLIEGTECISGNYIDMIDEAKFDDNTYIVILTHKHQFDEEVLAAVIHKPHAYVGVIGSKRKAAEIRKKFIDNKILPEEEFNKIDLPIGIAFRTETPEEIAVSIVAKLIDTRNTIKKS